MMRVGIIVLSWNSKALIDDCLRGVLKFEKAPVYVVDNGSVDGSVEYIAANYPTVHLLKSPVNLGFAAGNNFGIKRALEDGCDAVFLLNNDTIIDEPFLAPCVEILQRDPSVGIVGPVVVEGHRPDVVQCIGGEIVLWNLGFQYIGAGLAYKRTNELQEVGYVLGAAMLIRREILDATGGLDPEYYPAYVEEADLCYRAHLMGYKSVVCHSVRVRHIGASSSGGNASSFRRFTANRFLFGLKHLDPARFLIASMGIVVRTFARKVVVRGNLRSGPPPSKG